MCVGLVKLYRSIWRNVCSYEKYFYYTLCNHTTIYFPSADQNCTELQGLGVVQRLVTLLNSQDKVVRACGIICLAVMIPHCKLMGRYWYGTLYQDNTSSLIMNIYIYYSIGKEIAIEVKLYSFISEHAQTRWLVNVNCIISLVYCLLLIEELFVVERASYVVSHLAGMLMPMFMHIYIYSATYICCMHKNSGVETVQ